nr:oxygen-independent coproporphyrinogen III oxidase [Sphingomonas sp.]
MTYYPGLLATPVPRYTSYPTAAEFTDLVGRSDMEAALAGVRADEPLSLYVHIPYCHEICWYCGCNTGAANKAQRLTGYLEGLEAEIALVAARLGGRGKVQRIAFGGGSPNAIAPDQFSALLDQLRSSFAANDALLSIELDPRSLNGRWFEAIAAAEVKRASLGVQTLEPKVQRAIGRWQPLGLIETAVKELRRAGVMSLNFDLMYGLPYQGIGELEATLETTLKLRPDRVALFGYAHVPHLIPRQRRIDGTTLPDGELRFSQAELGHRVLTEAGYRAVGFDHYALPGDPLAAASAAGQLRRNFQGFTEDPADVLIGLGASAISQFPHFLVQNDKNAGRYRTRVSAGLLPADRGVTRSKEDQERGRIIERLLCGAEARVEWLVDAELMDRLDPFIARGLILFDGSRIWLNDEARPYARVIASLFDTYRQPAARRFSSAI